MGHTAQADPVIEAAGPGLDDYQPAYDDQDGDGDAARPNWPQRIAAIFLGLAALAWIGIAGWHLRSVIAGGAPALVSAAATVCMPLTLIGIAWLLLQRTSRREARRFARTATAMRAEATQLEHVLATLSAQIAANRRELADHAHQLLLLGDEATARLSGISAGMRSETGEIARHSSQLEQAARGARGDMALLLQDLPRATSESRSIATLLQEAGIGAQEQAGALSAALSAISQGGREAEDVAGGAAQRLAAHLAQIEGTSALAGERIEAVAGQIGSTVDTALTQAAGALDEARRAIDTQAAAMIAMSEQARVALEQAGAESAQALAKRLDQIGGRLDDLAAQLATQAQAGGAMVGTIDAGLSAITGRIEALGATGAEQSAGLAAAFDHLEDRADRIDASLIRGVQSAEALVDRAGTVNGLLREGGEELRIILPQALDRLAQRVAESHGALAALVPQAETLAASANDAATKLHGADALLLRQATTMRALGLAAEERLAAIRDQAGQLEAAITGSAEQARALAEGAGPQLIDSLLRVRETAMQAAQHAREAFTSVIPAAAASLGSAAREALARVMEDGIEEQMAEVAATSEQAVQAAQRVTERLMRQMLTIADTTAAIEARIADARAEAEEADEETFSRRVTLLIDQLNSTAINVTGLLSQEIAETSWASYLKGDRGVFTRRAVRLLDGAEVREILRLYNGDTEFRDQLNRYVHDFEAMLRRVLASREGSQLAVTLLSSDMGKLYVALAQAIERLRT
nr:hypothetical protein [Sphingomonas bacterium]